MRSKASLLLQESVDFVCFALCVGCGHAGHFPPPSPLRAQQLTAQSRTPTLTAPDSWLDTSKIMSNSGPALIIQPALLSASPGPSPTRSSLSLSAQRDTGARACSAGTRRSSKSSNVSDQAREHARAEELLSSKPQRAPTRTSSHMAGSISRVLLRQQALDIHSGHAHADGAECDCVFLSRAASALKHFLSRLGPT